MCELGPGDRGDQVDLEDLPDRARVGVEHRSEDRVDAGVVDEDVKPAVRADGSGHRFGLVIRIVGLARDRDRVLLAAELLDRSLQRVRLARGDTHLRALGDQPLGDAETDTAAGARDESDLPRKTIHIETPPSTGSTTPVT